MDQQVKFVNQVIATRQKMANAMKPGPKKNAALKDISQGKKLLALTRIFKKKVKSIMNGK